MTIISVFYRASAMFTGALFFCNFGEFLLSKFLMVLSNFRQLGQIFDIFGDEFLENYKKMVKKWHFSVQVSKFKMNLDSNLDSIFWQIYSGKWSKNGILSKCPSFFLLFFFFFFFFKIKKVKNNYIVGKFGRNHFLE